MSEDTNEVVETTVSTTAQHEYGAAQIDKLARQSQAKGFTIIPLSLYFKDGRVKVEIALARGKKEFDKRQSLREEQDKREALRAMRYANKQVR